MGSLAMTCDAISLYRPGVVDAGVGRLPVTHGLSTRGQRGGGALGMRHATLLVRSDTRLGLDRRDGYRVDDVSHEGTT